MKNEQISVRITAEQREMLEALGGGKPSAGISEIFGRLQWLRQTLPVLPKAEKMAVVAALKSTMWTPAITGDALAHEIEDYAEFEELEASQFDVDYKALAEKASGWDRLTIFAILLASAAIMGSESLQKGIDKYW